MANKNFRLKGHESFTLRDGWITKGLLAVSSDSKLYSINSGADALGVGTNMAKSIRYWMKTAGLTYDKQGQGVFLTQIGQIIAENDLYIEDIFTLWIIHINIVSNYENATTWNLFFNYMDLVSAFSRDEMQNLIKSLLFEHSGLEEPSERSIKDDCAALISMYGRGSDPGDDPEEKRFSPFEELGLLEHRGNKIIKKRPSLDKIDEFVLLYLIIDELNKNGSMQIDYITDGVNMPGKLLNLNRIAVNEYLDELYRHKYININRTAGLDIVYPDKCQSLTREDVVRIYYERSRI